MSRWGGLWTTKAMDWKIAYDEEKSDSFTIVAGIAWLGFILASESAQRLDAFVLQGGSLKFDVGIQKLIDRLRKIFEKTNSPDPPLFWPLDVRQAFSVRDLDYATGSATTIAGGETLVLRFGAEGTGGPRPGADGYQKASGPLFNQSGAGLPVSGQFPNAGISAIDGTWYLVQRERIERFDPGKG